VHDKYRSKFSFARIVVVQEDEEDASAACLAFRSEAVFNFAFGAREK
jgi:hypothetical protein